VDFTGRFPLEIFFALRARSLDPRGCWRRYDTRLIRLAADMVRHPHHGVRHPVGFLFVFVVGLPMRSLAWTTGGNGVGAETNLLH
jgi:hypothetical protein